MPLDYAYLISCKQFLYKKLFIIWLALLIDNKFFEGKDNLKAIALSIIVGASIDEMMIGYGLVVCDCRYMLYCSCK